MATGFPAATGDVLSAAMYNGLVAFTVSADQTSDYTAVLADGYQALIPMNKATAIAFKIPTNASVAFPVGTTINIVNQSSSSMTIATQAGNVNLYMAGNSTAANRVVGTYGMATLLKVASDTWFINGTGVY